MEMTKFSDKDDPGFVAVAAELRRWIKNMDIQSFQPNEQQIPLRM